MEGEKYSMSREGKLVKNTFILAVGTFFPKLAIFVALPILTAYFTKTEYGTYDLVVTLVSFVLPAATLQIQAAAFRFLIDVKENEEEKEKIISNIYIFVAVASVVVLTIAFLVLRKQPITIRLAICLYYLFDIFSIVSRQIIRGLFRNIDYAISSIISGAGQIMFIILLVAGFKTGLAGGLAALAIAELLSTIYLLYRGKIYKYIKINKVEKEVIKELLGYSWPMVPNSLSQWVIHASDRLIITFFMGTAANAVYSVAYKIPSILSLAQTTFNMAWQENASISANDDDAAAYYSSMFKWLFNIIVGMMSILIGFTPILFKLFIRGDYVEAYNQIPILFMGMFFLCLSTFWGGIFVAMKKTKEVGTTTVIAAMLHLSINLTMIRIFGLYAASVACVIAYSLLCLMRAVRVQKIIKISYDVKHIGVFIAILLGQCMLCFLQNKYTNIINFVGGFIIGIALNYPLIVAVFRRFFGGFYNNRDTIK